MAFGPPWWGHLAYLARVRKGGPRSMGGTGSFHPALEVQSVSSTKSSTPTIVSLVQPDVNLVVSVLEDSSLDPSVPPHTNSSPSATAVVAIKDKAANLGLKDITDKDSWINTKKIINARLCRPPYYPGLVSKAFVTTKRQPGCQLLVGGGPELLCQAPHLRSVH